MELPSTIHPTKFKIGDYFFRVVAYTQLIESPPAEREESGGPPEGGLKPGSPWGKPS